MATKTKKEKTKKKSRFGWLKRVFQGRVISSDFFKRHWVFVLLVTGFFVCFIGSKYHNQNQMAAIMKLSSDLNNAKTEKVKASASYNTRIREPEMKSLVDSMKLNLDVPQTPPYRL